MLKVVAEKPVEAGRRAWNTPELKAVGTVGDVLAQGGGKPSSAPGDPGEPRKVTKQG